MGLKTSTVRQYFYRSVTHYSLITQQKFETKYEISDEINIFQIPASIEEVIAAVSTGKPTVSANFSDNSCPNASNNPCKEYNTNRNNQSLDAVKKRLIKIRKTIKGNKINSCKSNNIKVKLKHRKYINLKERQKLENVSSADNKHNNLSPRREITTGKGLAVPISDGEEIVCIILMNKKQQVQHLNLQVKLVKVEDGDVDVDIDVDLSDDDSGVSNKDLKNQQQELLDMYNMKSQLNCKENPENKISSKSCGNHLKLDEETSNLIKSTEVPMCEMILEPYNISQLEKVINWDYFEGGNVKTPQRYLKVKKNI